MIDAAVKTKFNSLALVLVLLAGVCPALAQPILGITPGSHQALLFWPAADTNYVLQSTTNLVLQNWGPVTDSVPVAINDSMNVTVTNNSSTRFFRLFKTSLTPAGMVLIPTGVFQMGDPLDGMFDAIPATNVTVSAFYMDTNLVSYSQWLTVYIYATNHGYGFVNPGAGRGANYPVWQVDWFDVVKWSNARSQQAGLAPVYYTDAGHTQVYTNGGLGTAVFANWLSPGYRLPTEAEWEKAARGGLNGLRFPWGNLISQTNANYTGNTGASYDLGPNGNAWGNSTSPVGYFAANGYGLYDMAGNLEEWCWDYYAPQPYPAGSPYLGGSDPRGPTSGSNRTARGGTWLGYGNECRCASRSPSAPDYAFYAILGFRCVKGL